MILLVKNVKIWNSFFVKACGEQLMLRDIYVWVQSFYAATISSKMNHYTWKMEMLLFLFSKIQKLSCNILFHSFSPLKRLWYYDSFHFLEYLWYFMHPKNFMKRVFYSKNIVFTTKTITNNSHIEIGWKRLLILFSSLLQAKDVNIWPVWVSCITHLM